MDGDHPRSISESSLRLSHVSFREAGNIPVLCLAAEGSAEPGCESSHWSQRTYLAQRHPDRIRAQGVVAEKPVRIMVAVGAPALDRVMPAIYDVPAERHEIFRGELRKQHGDVRFLLTREGSRRPTGTTRR